MRKAEVLSILFVVVLLAVAVIAEAQQPKKVPQIGHLNGSSLSAAEGAGESGPGDQVTVDQEAMPLLN